MAFQAPRTPAQALAGLLELTPQGWALPDDPTSVWAGFVSPIAAEWSRIETTAAAMLAELDMRTAPNMLPDYQRVLGPDAYGRDAAGLGLSEDQAARLAWARWTAGGNMAPSDYVALAAQAGVTITVQQYWPSICGLMQCGDELGDDRWFECGRSHCGNALGWEPLVFTWLARLPTWLTGRFECGGGECGDLLGNTEAGALLAGAIAGEAPSHTNPVFIYS
jgi:uncharacterized protein YmfQ (DUF2313 family)